MLKTWKNEALTDVVNLVLGIWLFPSPWILGFAPQMAVSWNAWLSGIVVAGLAVAALAVFVEWLNLIVGIWVAISPWVVAFSANTTATRNHLVVGVIVAVVAAVRLWFLNQGPPRVTARG
jgi:SPW repeat